jgi:hypothetical protein
MKQIDQQSKPQLMKNEHLELGAVQESVHRVDLKNAEQFMLTK